MVKSGKPKMGIHEWSYDNEVVNDTRYVVPQAEKAQVLKSIKKKWNWDLIYPQVLKKPNVA